MARTFSTGHKPGTMNELYLKNFWESGGMGQGGIILLPYTKVNFAIRKFAIRLAGAVL